MKINKFAVIIIFLFVSTYFSPLYAGTDTFEYSDVWKVSWRYWTLFAYGVLFLTLYLSFAFAKKEWPRWLKLLIVVTGETVALIFFWEAVEKFITMGERSEWLKGLLPILLAAVPAYLLWHWRDSNRRRELGHQAEELRLKTNNDAWDNFIKYQKMAEDVKGEHSEGTRAAAIFALGEYYEREGTQFPNQVHVFFKQFLDNFWDGQEVYHEYQQKEEIYNEAVATYRRKLAEKDNVVSWKNFETEEKQLFKSTERLKAIELPEYIKALHRVFVLKSKVKLNKKNLFHRDNQLLFTGFNLTSANLSLGIFPNTNFSKAILPDVNFSKAILSDAHFFGVSSPGANFSEAKLFNINFCSATLSGTNFRNAIFFGVNFNAAILSEVNFNGAKLSNVDFSRVVLSNAFFGFTTLSSVDFRGVAFPGANFNGATLSSVSFLSAILAGADFRRVTLLETDFRWTALSGADFSRANFSGVYLKKYKLERAYSMFFLKLKILYSKDFKLTRHYKNLHNWKKYKFLFSVWKPESDFTMARYDDKTKFPSGFDKKKAGMVPIGKTKSETKLKAKENVEE
jgi:uncharacterized protein YjbI with pentapeptide repeats